MRIIRSLLTGDHHLSPPQDNQRNFLHDLSSLRRIHAAQLAWILTERRMQMMQLEGDNESQFISNKYINAKSKNKMKERDVRASVRSTQWVDAVLVKQPSAKTH